MNNETWCLWMPTSCPGAQLRAEIKFYKRKIKKQSRIRQYSILNISSQDIVSNNVIVKIFGQDFVLKVLKVMIQ